MSRHEHRRCFLSRVVPQHPGITACDLLRRDPALLVWAAGLHPHTDYPTLHYHACFIGRVGEELHPGLMSCRCTTKKWKKKAKWPIWLFDK